MPEGGGVNEAEVARDELTEGIFAARGGVAAEQRVVIVGGRHCVVHGVIAAGGEIRPRGGEIFGKIKPARRSEEIPLARAGGPGTVRA